MDTTWARVAVHQNGCLDLKTEFPISGWACQRILLLSERVILKILCHGIYSFCLFVSQKLPELLPGVSHTPSPVFPEMHLPLAVPSVPTIVPAWPSEPPTYGPTGWRTNAFSVEKEYCILLRIAVINLGLKVTDRTVQVCLGPAVADQVEVEGLHRKCICYHGFLKVWSDRHQGNQISSGFVISFCPVLPVAYAHILSSWTS